MSQRFREGDRVRYTGSPVLGPSYGSVGTVALVAGFKGKSIYCDPSRLMVFVKWDADRPQGVFKRMLQRVAA